MKLFAIYDSKAETFNAPWHSATIATALRAFTQAAMDEGHEFHKHGGDYSLFCIGEFDDETGLLTPSVPLTNLGTALQNHGGKEEAPEIAVA